MNKDVSKSFQIEKRNTLTEANLNPEVVSVNEEEESTKTEDLVLKYTKDGHKVYQVLLYQNNCEEHNQISLIVPLARTTPKFVLFIILNIFTV